MYKGGRCLARARRLDTFRDDREIEMNSWGRRSRSLIQWHDDTLSGRCFCATLSLATM